MEKRYFQSEGRIWTEAASHPSRGHNITGFYTSKNPLAIRFGQSPPIWLEAEGIALKMGKTFSMQDTNVMRLLWSLEI